MIDLLYEFIAKTSLTLIVASLAVMMVGVAIRAIQIMFTDV
jgi:hypothetical protein